MQLTYSEDSQDERLTSSSI